MNNQKRNPSRRYPNKQGQPIRSRRQGPSRKRVPVSPLTNQKIGPVNTSKTNAKFTRSNYNQQVNNIVQTMEKTIQQLQQENIALKNKLGQTEKTAETL
jgi:hypothetical protein